MTDAATCKEAVDKEIEALKVVDENEPEGTLDEFSKNDWCFVALVQAAGEGYDANAAC